MIETVPPAAVYILGAFLVPFLKGRWKSAYLLIIPVIGFSNLISIPEGAHFVTRFLDYDLVFVRIDRLSFLFGIIFHLISFIAILYALHVKDDLQHVAGLVYAGSALGVVFAGDLFTFFIFWEMLTVASIFLIWAPQDTGGPVGRVPLPAGACSGRPLSAGRNSHPCEPDMLH